MAKKNSGPQEGIKGVVEDVKGKENPFARGFQAIGF